MIYIIQTDEEIADWLTNQLLPCSPSIIWPAFFHQPLDAIFILSNLSVIVFKFEVFNNWYQKFSLTKFTTKLQKNFFPPPTPHPPTAAYISIRISNCILYHSVHVFNQVLFYFLLLYVPILLLHFPLMSGVPVLTLGFTLPTAGRRFPHCGFSWSAWWPFNQGFC